MLLPDRVLYAIRLCLSREASVDLFFIFAIPPRLVHILVTEVFFTFERGNLVRLR